VPAFRPAQAGNARWWAVLLAVIAVTSTACAAAPPAAGGSGDVGRFDAFGNVATDPGAAAKVPARVTQAGKLVVVMNVSSAPVEFYATDNKTGSATAASAISCTSCPSATSRGSGPASGWCSSSSTSSRT
jgi:hypothetical protein